MFFGQCVESIDSVRQARASDDFDGKCCSFAFAALESWFEFCGSSKSSAPAVARRNGAKLLDGKSEAFASVLVQSGISIATIAESDTGWKRGRQGIHRKVVFCDAWLLLCSL